MLKPGEGYDVRDTEAQNGNRGRQTYRMRQTVISTILAYLLLLLACLYLYHHYPVYIKQIEFWIPQLFLLVMITVTSLYVFFTASLVEETRRLQDRPMIQLAYREVSEMPTLKYG